MATQPHSWIFDASTGRALLELVWTGQLAGVDQLVWTSDGCFIPALGKNISFATAPAPPDRLRRFQCHAVSLHQHPDQPSLLIYDPEPLRNAGASCLWEATGTNRSWFAWQVLPWGLAVPDGPRKVSRVAWHPFCCHVYACNDHSGRLFVLDSLQNAVVQSWQLPVACDQSSWFKSNDEGVTMTHIKWSACGTKLTICRASGRAVILTFVGKRHSAADGTELSGVSTDVDKTMDWRKYLTFP